MTKEGGVYTIPCDVNGLRLKFIFDTGASDVSISLSEAIFMIKNDYLSENDVKGSTYYQIANGDIVEGTTINLRTLKIGNKVLYNVKASIVHSLSSPLLLGQSALSKFGKFSFDYSNNKLILGYGLIATNNQTSVKNNATDNQTSVKKVGCISGDCVNGYGTYIWTFGDKYTGNWKEDKMHGQGTYTWQDGDKYIGNWINHARHGQGTYTYSSGETKKVYHNHGIEIFK